MHTVTRTPVETAELPPLSPYFRTIRAALDRAAAERGLPPEPWPA